MFQGIGSAVAAVSESMFREYRVPPERASRGEKLRCNIQLACRKGLTEDICIMVKDGIERRRVEATRGGFLL